MQLQKDLQRIEASGVGVVGISYDSVEVLKKFSDEQKITYPLLADVASKTIDAFGVRNRQVPAGSRQDGVAHPLTIIIDTGGVVRAKLPGSIRKRHSTADLLEAVEKIVD